MEDDIKNSGKVFIFDYDDTLMWSADWYSKATLDQQGYVKTPGESPSLKKALALIEEAKGMSNLPARFKNMKLKSGYSKQLNRRDIFFMVVDANDMPFLIDELEKYIPAEKLAKAKFEGRTSYTLYTAVIEDVAYYRDLNTLDTLGPNKYIMDIYKSQAGNAIILTARTDVPGMTEEISKVLEKHSGYKPKYVYAQPLGSGNSGLFKANVLMEIAKDKEVESIIFYEDNPEYIKTILNFLFLEKFKSKDKEEIVNKINVIPVSVDKKPDVNFKS